MPSPGTDPELMLARTIVVSMALQALIERLLLAGVLDARDLTGMRQLGLDLVADMRAHGAADAQIGVDRIEREITVWWKMLGTPEVHANNL